MPTSLLHLGATGLLSCVTPTPARVWPRDLTKTRNAPPRLGLRRLPLWLAGKVIVSSETMAGARSRFSVARWQNRLARRLTAETQLPLAC